MILRTTETRLSKAEVDLRKFLIAELGETDAESLARFTWETSKCAQAEYVDALAFLTRGIGSHGSSFVHKILEVAAKPRETREAEIDLTIFCKQLVDDLTQRILGAAPDDREMLAAECWKELQHRLRDRLSSMFPGRPDYIINGALISGTDWDKAGATFTIHVHMLVDSMKQKDPLS